MSKFSRALTACRTIEDIDKLLRVKTQRWCGKPLIPRDVDDTGEKSEDEERVEDEGYNGLVLFA